MPRVHNPNVMVGYETSDDAGVYRLSAECALVQTVDFFTPIVDDPYTFGAIAAANALSDVYAMGGTPITALSICAWPAKESIEDLQAIFRGGADKIHEAGCVVLGGHSINDEEIKFGYSVTGTVHPERVLTNAGARPGDVLVLTKPIGTGVIATALKRGLAGDEHVQASIASMLRLNRGSAEAIADLDVKGCTDVTGFGLLGHARELAVASDVTLEISALAIQFLPGALEYAQAGAIPGGQRNNEEFVRESVSVDSEIAAELLALMYDPQTSGGLLIAIAERDLGQLLVRQPDAFPIGRVVPKGGNPIHVVSRQVF
ncbi:MAG: selenide, water dikinase SelD [Bryobacteraceae bacterium]|nr:selenide, water dikinase SelD [Bryobacteraceae bacterium]